MVACVKEGNGLARKGEVVGPQGWEWEPGVLVMVQESVANGLVWHGKGIKRYSPVFLQREEEQYSP